MSSMGRRRVHDEHTRALLLEAAEALVAEGGIAAVGVRAVAERAGTTTRAVYALFGSKEELVQALAQRSYGLLMERVAAVPLTSDAGHDLISGAVEGFRAFALQHPHLFHLFFMTILPRSGLSAESNDSRLAALRQLIQLVERAHTTGLLGGHSVEEVTLLWDALCTGLAMREIQGVIQASTGERIWTDALGAMLIGLRSVEEIRKSSSRRRVTRSRRASSSAPSAASSSTQVMRKGILTNPSDTKDGVECHSG